LLLTAMPLQKTFSLLINNRVILYFVLTYFFPEENGI